jgi:hypothetical protein
VNWPTKHFIFAGILGATTFGAAFVLGAGIISATGIPATGGIANIFVCVFLIIIGMKIVPRFGFATLAVGLVFTFAVPTLIGGPPGIHKIANGLLIGLVLDVVAAGFGRTRGAYVAAGALGAMTSIVSIYFMLVLLGLPGAAKLRPLLLPLTLMQGVMGALAGWAAVAIFQGRLYRLEPVRRLMDVGGTSG